MKKILKVKTGDVYIDGQSYPVFQTAWKTKSKDGKTEYYQITSPIFVQEVQEKPKEEKVEV